MALSLTAEQKSLLTLFTTRDKFIIPSYQRPYSWEYEQCLKLYSDVIEAYQEKSDYFLGNIIVSRSKQDSDSPQIVDGQQRIITIWLAFKALSVLLPQIAVLKEVVSVRSWDGNTEDVKIKSLIFESDDNQKIIEVFAYTANDFKTKILTSRNEQGHIPPEKFKSNIITNALYFFNWFDAYIAQYGEESVIKFLQYFLQQVSLLPIELSGDNQKDADDKALTIFETINNRGRDLEDADIFKAKLYGRALTKHDQEDFIRLWVEFKTACDNQKISIDEAFRYYSHIIRGEENVTSTEKNLRKFFVEDSKSPLNQKGYREVMMDLMHVLEAVEIVYKESKSSSELGAWIQLVYAYSNTYPLYATVVYVYKNGIDNKKAMISFLQKLIRYCYFQGATTVVKFEIYTIIYQVVNTLPIKDYCHKDIDVSHFDYLGRLKYGYALLAFYLEHKEAIPNCSIDKLLTSKDALCLDESWNSHEFYEHTDDIGNFIVIDCVKKNSPYYQKRISYSKSNICEVVDFMKDNECVTYDVLSKRSMEKKDILVHFFRGTEV